MGTPAGRDADQSNGGAQAFALIGIGPDRTIARQQTGLGGQHARMSSGLAQRQQLTGLGGQQACTSRQLRTQAAAGRPGRCRLACAAAGERSRPPQRQAWHGMHAASSWRSDGSPACPRSNVRARRRRCRRRQLAIMLGSCNTCTLLLLPCLQAATARSRCWTMAPATCGLCAMPSASWATASRRRVALLLLLLI